MTPLPSGDPGGKRARNKEDKRRRVRDAAWELFRTQGFDETTTKEIASRAGIASGTLFLYARDKTDLLFLILVERLTAAVDEGFATLPRDAPLVDQLVHLFSRYFLVYAEAPDVARRFVKEYPGARGPNADRITTLTLALNGQIAALVQAAQARGEVASEAPPLLFAHVAFALYYASLIGWLGGFAPLEAALPLLRSSLDLAYRGVAARPRSR